MLTAEEINTLKTKIKAEMKRRNGKGSVSAYGGTDYDFATKPIAGGTILTEHGEKTLGLMQKIATLGGELDNPIVQGEAIPVGFDSSLIDTINKWANESKTGSTTSCNASCTGLCTTGCHTACYGCSGCGGSCSYNCSGSCSGICTHACASSCASGCHGSCGDSCGTGCHGSCESGCSYNCGSGCAESCVSGCADYCITDCVGVNSNPY